METTIYISTDVNWYIKAKIALFDFTEPSTFSCSLEDVDRVFIMRPPHLGKPADLKPFIDALEAKGGIKLVSFLSLMGVEKNPVPPHHKIVVPVKKALTSFIDAQDIGEITAKVLSEPEFHQNRGYSITGSESIDYWKAAKILSKN